MQNNRLTRTLRTLNANELKRLLKFLNSPFNNANSNIVQLYLFVRNFYPMFDSPKLTKEQAFKKLFPHQKYNNQKLLNLMSDFSILLEKYLTILQLEKEEMEQKKLLVRAYAQRPNCYPVFEKKIWELNKELDAMPYRDEHYFKEKKELNLQHYGHPDTSKAMDKKNTLQTAEEYFYAYCSFAEIKIKCAKNAVVNTISRKNTDPKINGDLLKDNPAFVLYEKIEKFQRSRDATNLNELADYFISHIKSLRIDDREYILKVLLNFSIRQNNAGRTEFSKVILDLYKIGLEYKCLLFFGRMTENTFQNIVTTAALQGEFEWANKFMDKYQGHLDTGVRADAMAISMAQWHFTKKEFLQAIEVLGHTFKEPIDVLKSKSLLVRSWYEMYLKDDNFLEMVLAQLAALEKFLRRDKTMPPRMKDAYLKFVSFTKKLVNGKWDKDLMNELNKEISQDTNLLIKKWLMEKSTVQ